LTIHHHAKPIKNAEGTMLLRLFLIFAIVPPLELYILLRLASIAGVGTTIVIVVATALIGSYLAKMQGILAWWRFRDALAQGRMPSAEIADGLMVIFAAALLLTPGLLTDLFGFTLLVPYSRRILRGWLVHRIGRNMRVNTVIFREGAFEENRDADVIDAHVRKPDHRGVAPANELRDE